VVLQAICPREMTMRFRTYLLLSALAVLAVSNMPADAADTTAVIKNAMSAAPDGVATNATIATFDDKMEMTILRKGTNGFIDRSTP